MAELWPKPFSILRRATNLYPLPYYTLVFVTHLSKSVMVFVTSFSSFFSGFSVFSISLICDCDWNISFFICEKEYLIIQWVVHFFFRTHHFLFNFQIVQDFFLWFVPIIYTLYLFSYNWSGIVWPVKGIKSTWDKSTVVEWILQIKSHQTLLIINSRLLCSITQ